MLSERQEHILHLLVKEYINAAEPVSSDLLKKKSKMDVSGATIRNDLQELTLQGYVAQPHTSAGRVPTDKGYQYFIEITFNKNNQAPDLTREITLARQNIEKELQLAQELIKSLTEISTTLSYTKIQNKDTIFETLKIIGPSRIHYQKNIDMMRQLLQDWENI